MDKENLLKQSSTVTNQLLSVSRQLANTSQQSLDTLETLCKHIILCTNHINKTGVLIDLSLLLLQ